MKISLEVTATHRALHPWHAYVPHIHQSTAFFILVQLWALTLLGRCFLLNEDAVVAEGLFRSAVDGFAGGRLEAGPVLFPSPLHPFSEAYAMRALWDLLRMWDKRESEAKQVLGNVEKVG